MVSNFVTSQKEKHMADAEKHILLIEPYYGGSHKAFLIGLTHHVPLEFTLLSLPARKWKMRMQVAAPWMAEQIVQLCSQGKQFDGLLCSTFIDVAVLKSLLALKGIHLPIAIYFHENQFAYPGQIRDPAYHQFTNINWTSALVAERIFFNSRFNYESFISGITFFVKKAVDMDLLQTVEQIMQKAVVLYPGIDFSALERTPDKHCLGREPVIVWNHRWEHDKDPETFFAALFQLQEEGVDFKLIVLGQHFRRQPDIFQVARKRLQKHIIHFGYAESQAEYANLLKQGDVVVSTAIHEFFGIAVLEAVYAGCRPLVPDRLSYPELYPEAYRYREGSLVKALQGALLKQSRESRETNRQLAGGFSWKEVAGLYEKQLLAYCS